jgi:hypothetical protein
MNPQDVYFFSFSSYLLLFFKKTYALTPNMLQERNMRHANMIKYAFLYKVIHSILLTAR